MKDVQVWFDQPRGSEPGTPATGWRTQISGADPREAQRAAEDYRGQGRLVRVVEAR